MIGADFLIPSGKLFENMLKAGMLKVHRDTFHAKLGLGRYALGLLWHGVLTGREVKDVTFCNFDEPVTEKEIKTAKDCVKKIIIG